jgi:hypothetical protein
MLLAVLRAFGPKAWLISAQGEALGSRVVLSLQANGLLHQSYESRL